MGFNSGFKGLRGSTYIEESYRERTLGKTKVDAGILGKCQID